MQCRKVISYLRGGCGVRYHRVRAKLKSKFAHRPISCDAIRVSLIAESTRKRDTMFVERFNWLSRVRRTQDAIEPG